MIILLIGPQASGKGTQAKLLVEKFGMTYFEMGKIFREISKERSSWGRRISAFVLNGKPVPDDLTIQIADKSFEQMKDLGNVVFDGLPRTPDQAKYLEDLLSKHGKKIDLVVYLSLAKEKVFERLANRRTCSQCGRVYNTVTSPPIVDGVCDSCGGKLVVRDDETPERIYRRLSWFDLNVLPTIEYFKGKGLVEEVDGDRPIEVIFKDIVERLKKRGLV